MSKQLANCNCLSLRLVAEVSIWVGSVVLHSIIEHDRNNKQSHCKKAKLQAGIKPTALCSAIDKENSIEFPLDFLHYLYNYYMVCALVSNAYHVTL